MSSRGEVSKHRHRSRSLSPHRKHEHKSRSKHSSETDPRSKSKHRSVSKDRKHSKEMKKKSKKKKKRDSSSSSSSSGSEEEELKLLQRLEAERQRVKEEKRKQKELIKANETPEQKRARRLKEKQEKERKRRERMGWDGEYQCYTDQDNPFGDSALTNTFVWSKKLAKEGVKTVSREEIEAQNRQKQMENKIELEKVKQRRLEREAERAAREAEAAAAARAREAAQYSSWARHEDAFHLQQARLRSQIRIRDGRAKPIDLLAWYVSSEQSADALEMHEPYTYLHGLSAADLDDLKEDIKVYMELESDTHRSYWEDVHIIVTEALEAASAAQRDLAARRSVHQSVAEDVTQIFKGKTGEQLEALQAQIEAKIAAGRGAGGAGGGAGGGGVDVGYWEALAGQLRAHQARARLRARHQHNLRTKLQLLQQQQGVDAAETTQPTVKSESPTPSRGSQGDQEGETSGAGTAQADEELSEEALEKWCVAEYCRNTYSPEPLQPDQVEAGTLVAGAAEEAARLHYLRSRLHAAAAPPPAAPALPPGQRAMEREARRGMGGDEAEFSVEQALPELPCAWADKYRPRKPRYFNRVHTGFEWNKYNQTHYDMDNPPPKIVQGYKFNIFYPDLIDKQATPQFSLKPCPENADFAILRFSAGPPYEDIAFKIVNREWEYSYKRGFRCHFHNNIFQLWFHFKRYRYRR